MQESQAPSEQGVQTRDRLERLRQLHCRQLRHRGLLRAVATASRPVGVFCSACGCGVYCNGGGCDVFYGGVCVYVVIECCGLCGV